MSVFAVSMAATGSMLSRVDAGVVNFGSFSGDFVTVGDPGNTANTDGSGAVADTFQIMKYEVTNLQYAAFLNSVAATDAYSLYHADMDGDRGGIARNGTSGAFSYTVKSNMGDKPVMRITWFTAARYSNWLHNGAMSSASTETGAYNLQGRTTGDAVALVSGARYFIPSRNQWYKAAYYKGGSTNAGYWNYATQSDAIPTAVTAGATGVGSAGSSGNFANYGFSANWNSTTGGNVTTVGTNGGASYYGTFDMTGNVSEWNDSNGSSPLNTRGVLGGSWQSTSAELLIPIALPPNGSSNTLGFRIASLPSSAVVPEPSMMAIGILFGLGGIMAKRRMVR